jgi:hypothetical protein
MYAPESVESLRARSDVVVIAAIHEVVFSAGPKTPPLTDLSGQPVALTPGEPLPRQPDQILGLAILNVLAGTLPPGQVTVYKIDEGYFVDETDIGNRWLFFLAREPSGRWRIAAAYRPEDVATVRAHLAACDDQLP